MPNFKSVVHIIQVDFNIIPSKLINELQHSARLGKTFPVGWGCAGIKANLSQLGLGLR